MLDAKTRNFGDMCTGKITWIGGDVGMRRTSTD